MSNFLDFLTGGIQSSLPQSVEASAPGVTASEPKADIASRLKQDLQRDFGLNEIQAAAFVGNLAHESGGFKSLQEIQPMIPGSRGGFGYAQWTGPRRRQFEGWTEEKGLDPTSYDANYGFLKHELSNTPEGRVLQSLRQANDPVTATQIVSDQFLRPGIPGMGSRQRWTQRVLGGDAIGAEGEPGQNRALAYAATRGRDPRANMPAPDAVQTMGQAPMPSRQMPQQDPAHSPDGGARDFLLREYGMSPDMQQGAAQGGPGFVERLVGGLGGLGGMRMPGLSQSAAPAQSGGSPDIESLVPSNRPNPFAFFGKPAMENQKAEAQRQGSIATARMLVEKGVDPRQAVALAQNPQALQLYLQDKQRSESTAFEREKFEFTKKNVEADNKRADDASMSAPRKILRDLGIEPGHPEYKDQYKRLAGLGPAGASAEVAQRKIDAEALGLKPDNPGYQSFVLTGRMPREDAQPLSATDKKAILEADEGVMASEGAIKALQDAKKISPRALGGIGAGTRAMLGNALPDGLVPDAVASKDASLATAELDNIVSTNALSQLKSIFGAAPTEGERKILMDIQGSVSQPDNVRQAIYDRAIMMAEKRLQFNRQRANELRGGAYYKPGDKQAAPTSGAPAAPAPPPQADQPQPSGGGLKPGVYEFVPGKGLVAK